MHRFLSEKNLNGYHLGARSIQPKFPEILVQNSMDRCGPTGTEIRENGSTFPGRTGRKFWSNGLRPRKSDPKTFFHPSPRNYTHFVDEGYSSVAEPGEGPGGPPPLFLDQTEPPRAEKNFLKPPPTYLRVWMTGPFPYLKVWIRHCSCSWPVQCSTY